MLGQMTEEYVVDVAALHCETVTSFLSALGLRAARAFYRGAVQSYWGIGFVYLESGVVRGFVLGSTNPSRLRRAILFMNLSQTLWGLFVGLMRQPSAVVPLLRSFTGPSGKYNRDSAELIYLGVDGGYRGSGIGSRLVKAFNQALREKGLNTYELSVHADNVGSITFYEKLGFQSVGEYWEFGILHRRYRFKLE